ncbi:MAG: FlgO family outer membrane protein [Candidatus Aminicenantes bacterium]
MKTKRVKGLNYLVLFVFTVMFGFTSLWASTGYEKEIENISKTMAEKIAAAGKQKVAVVDFTDLQGSVTELGRFISEEFSISLASAGKGFTVVDRTHLKSILEEHKLSAKGLIDPATARKLGKIAGVEALVTGTLTPFGDSVRISVKILDTETATIIDANRGNIPMIDAIKELMGTGVGSSAGQQTPAYKKRKLGKPQQTKAVSDFTFEVLNCKVSGSTGTCTVMITNKTGDREFAISGDSRIYDDFGNEHRAQTVHIANLSQNLHGHKYNYIKKILISGVPTKTKLTFIEVSSEATMITSFKIRCWTKKEKDFWVDFRNIPITR